MSTSGATSPLPTSPAAAAGAAVSFKIRSSPVPSQQLPVVNGVRVASATALGVSNGGGSRANGVAKQLMPDGVGDKLDGGAPLAVPLDQQQQQLQPQQV